MRVPHPSATPPSPLPRNLLKRIQKGGSCATECVILPSRTGRIITLKGRTYRRVQAVFAKERRGSNPRRTELLLRCFGGTAQTFIRATCSKASEREKQAAKFKAAPGCRVPTVKPDAEPPERRSCNLPGSLGAKWLLLFSRDNIFRAADLEICSVKPNSSSSGAWTVAAQPSGGNEPPAGDLRVLAAALCVAHEAVRYLSRCFATSLKTSAGKKKKNCKAAF